MEEEKDTFGFFETGSDDIEKDKKLAEKLIDIDNFRTITDLNEAEIQSISELEAFALNPFPIFAEKMIKKLYEEMTDEEKKLKSKIKETIIMQLLEIDKIEGLSIKFILSELTLYKINRINKDRMNRGEIVDSIKAEAKETLNILESAIKRNKI